MVSAGFSAYLSEKSVEISDSGSINRLSDRTITFSQRHNRRHSRFSHSFYAVFTLINCSKPPRSVVYIEIKL